MIFSLENRILTINKIKGIIINNTNNHNREKRKDNFINRISNKTGKI